MESERRFPGPAQIILAGILIVILIFVLKGIFKDGNGGLLGSNDCSTSLEYKVPKEQLLGVSSTMTAVRCAGSYDDNGKKLPYVQVAVVVNGKTSDGSNVKGLKEEITLEKRTDGGRWVQVTPSDIPKDSGVSTDGSSVAFEKQVRWQMRHIPARIMVRLALKAENHKKPARAVHTFYLP